MKLLIVTPEIDQWSGGGIGTYYDILIPHLSGLGWEIRIICASPHYLDIQKTKIGEALIEFLPKSLFSRWKSQFEGGLAIRPLIDHLAAAYAAHEYAGDGWQPDVVEVVDYGLLFVPWSVDATCGIAIQLHGSIGQISMYDPQKGQETAGFLSLLLERTCIPLAAVVISNSVSNALWWESLLGTIPEIVDPPMLAITEALGDPREKSGWIAAGRVQKWKGCETLAKAWELLGQDAPSITWFGADTVLGGTGSSMTSWLTQHFPNHWGKSISHRDRLPREVLSQSIHSAQFVVIPSEWDVFNMVAAEAMAAECVVLVSTGAGAHDLIQHGVNGFVFERDNPAALATLVNSLLCYQYADLAQIGSEARKTVMHRMSPERIASEKSACLEKAVTRRPPEIPAILATALSSIRNTDSKDFLRTLSGQSLVSGIADALLRRTLSFRP